MRKPLLFAACLALAGAGCILTSGQFQVSFDIGNVRVTSPTEIQGVPVDLSTISAYRDHKANLHGLADVALLGQISNTGAAVAAEVWLTTGPTTYTNATDIRSHGLRVWGPLQVAAGETRRLGWDESAQLFSLEGRAVILEEVKGDGKFALYILGQIGTYSFNVQNAVLVLVLDAGV